MSGRGRSVFPRPLTPGPRPPHVEPLSAGPAVLGNPPEPPHHGVHQTARQWGHDVSPEAPRAPQLPGLYLDGRLDSQTGSL